MLFPPNASLPRAGTIGCVSVALPGTNAGSARHGYPGLADPQSAGAPSLQHHRLDHPRDLLPPCGYQPSPGLDKPMFHPA